MTRSLLAIPTKTEARTDSCVLRMAHTQRPWGSCYASVQVDEPAGELLQPPEKCAMLNSSISRE